MCSSNFFRLCTPKMFRDDDSQSISSIESSSNEKHKKNNQKSNSKSNSSITTVSLSSEIENEKENRNQEFQVKLQKPSSTALDNSCSSSSSSNLSSSRSKEVQNDHESQAPKFFANNIINTSLKETTDLLELLTIEERYKRQQFDRNIISVENTPREESQDQGQHDQDLIEQIKVQRIRPKSAKINQDRDLHRTNKSETSFPSSQITQEQRVKSAKGGSRTKRIQFRRNSSSISRISSSSDNTVTKSKSRKNNKSIERIEKLYNTQKYVEGASSSSATRKDRIDKVERSKNYDDNESVRKAMSHTKSSRSHFARPSGSGLSNYESILTNRPKTAQPAGLGLIKQAPIKHPVKNKNFSFTQTRIKEIQRENMRLYKNLLTINRPKTAVDRTDRNRTNTNNTNNSSRHSNAGSQISSVNNKYHNHQNSIGNSNLDNFGNLSSDREYNNSFSMNSNTNSGKRISESDAASEVSTIVSVSKSKKKIDGAGGDMKGLAPFGEGVEDRGEKT